MTEGRLAGGVFTSEDAGDTWRSCMQGGLNLQTRRKDQWAHGDIPQYRFIATTDKNPRRVTGANRASPKKRRRWRRERRLRGPSSARTWIVGLPGRPSMMLVPEALLCAGGRARGDSRPDQWG